MTCKTRNDVVPGFTLQSASDTGGSEFPKRACVVMTPVTKKAAVAAIDLEHRKDESKRIQRR